jgi:hypothetical protein
MKRSTIKKSLGITAVVVAVATLVFWGQISEAFGPMEQHELQCLICNRERIEKWVCGSKVRDDIVTNEYSDWIDSFTPPDHQHVWTRHTSYHRHRWFGGTSIACGGVPTIPRIFECRRKLGESEAQQLAAKFHQLVKAQSPQIDFSELSRFEKAVTENPDSLLKPENPN